MATGQTSTPSNGAKVAPLLKAAPPSASPDQAALVRGRIYNRAKGGEGRPKKLGKSCPVSEGSTAETLAPKLGVSAQPLPPKPRCPADVDV